MRQPPFDPDAADEAPVADMLTPYDHEHLVTYLRLLDAEAMELDWKEAARTILHIDPDREFDAGAVFMGEPYAASLLDDRRGVSAPSPPVAAALTFHSIRPVIPPSRGTRLHIRIKNQN